jgi:hypothetical protein
MHSEYDVKTYSEYVNEVVRSSETMVSINQSTQCYNQEHHYCNFTVRKISLIQRIILACLHFITKNWAEFDKVVMQI